MLNFLRDDSSLSLLGESIADSFMVVSLSGEIYHYRFIRGVKVSWLYSSAESTLYLEDRATCTVRIILIAPVSAGEGACGGPVDRVLSPPMRCLVSFGQNDKSSSGRPVTR